MSPPSEPAAPVSPHVAVALTVLNRIGVFGVLLVLWTAIMCCALVGGDAATVQRIWSSLMTVWLSIAGLTGAVTLITSYAAWKVSKAGAPGMRPQVAPSQGAVEPPTKPAA